MCAVNPQYLICSWSPKCITSDEFSEVARGEKDIEDLAGVAV